MLRRRYRYDGVPLLTLNELQWRMKRQIDQKVKDGVYRFGKVVCCVCQGSNFELLADKDRYGLYVPVVICRVCGLIQTNPRMDEAAYRSFYNEEYRKLYVGDEGPTEQFFLQQREAGKAILQFFEKCRALPKDLSRCLVLEVGCGAGGILAAFKDRGCRVKGVDWGEDYVGFGRDKFGLDLSVGGIQDVERDLGRQPDIIIYSHVFEHVLNPREELNAMHRIGAPDGAVYLELPGVKNLMTRYERDFLRFLQNAHTYHFTLTTLKNLVQPAGFQLTAGDEVVRAILSKAPGGHPPPPIVNDYQEARTFLRRLEFWRMLYPYTRHGPWRAPRLAAGALVRKLGLYSTLKKALGRL
ncbi:MAG: class I SAM-dependent methyltransferase [bacterium]